ncbi:MAG: winged helix-turn-helix domain-containing protein [Ardenticatenaceae bacterium]|nr:winged helix-turn-helix domain-containing protein [Ardenticatenaceae bacterium]MCB9004568.1 winged helix-turn-helix domain-containing protein [Ardenticatenaceae bacterium]
MTTGNFLSREPVFNQEGFLGRRLELNWVHDKLSRSSPQNCNLIGEPRIGKSSLLYQVYAQQLGLPQGMKGLYIWLRLVELAQPNSLAFWRLAWQRLQHELGHPVADGAAADSATFTSALSASDWFQELATAVDQLLYEQGHQRLIFVIDDFDVLTGLDKQDLNWLRALATRHANHLAFVIGSSQPLVELTANLEDETAVSPFSNIFHSLHVGLLAQGEAEELCLKAAAAEGMSPLSTEDTAFLLREAGRHPDLLKVACGHLFNARRWEETDNALDENGAFYESDAFYDSVLSQFRFDGHTRWLCQRLLKRRTEDEQHTLCTLVNKQEGVPDRILANRLWRQLGLLEKREGKFAPFADVFHYWACQQIAAQAKEEVEETAVSPTPSPPIFQHMPARRRVILNQHEIPLTPLENRLLGYLAAHMDEVCRTEELHREIWGPGKSIAVVEKAINRLRGKLEGGDGPQRIILSVRGEGYLLRNPNE